MSVQLTPSKRQYDRRHTEPNGKGKRHKSSFNSQNIPLKVSRGSSMFRVLCLASKTGSIIGKGGSIISQLRQETGAKIRVEEAVPGCDERVIVIIGSDKESEVAADRSKEGIDETTNIAEGGDDANEQIEKGEDKKSICVEDLPAEKGMSSVQKALLLVFERMVEGESVADRRDDDSDKSSTFVVRLLVLSSQVGCLLGEGGSVIKKMSSDSGAEIHIIPMDKLPPCATPDDALLQINGGVDTVRRALQSVSRHLLENSPRDLGAVSANPSGPSSHSFGNHVSGAEAFPPPNYVFPHQGAPYAPGHMKPLENILTFRLLCPEEKVGGVIGKAGTIVKSLQHETGCEIKVRDRLPGSDDRIIVISGPARPDERISAAQDAVLRVLSRIVRATPEIKENTVMIKLLVSSHQIGCLLGKGGSVIAEMRKLSGAHIRVMGKDQLLNGASDNEELVQINGDFERVQDALMHITTRLRDHLFRDAFPPMDHPFNPTFPDQPPRFPSYGGMELSPPGMYSSFHKFDGVGGMPPHGGFQPHDDRPPFMHNIRRPGMPHNISERNPLSAWGPQGPTEGGGPLGMPDYAGAPQRRMGGFGGGSHLAIITNTTVEVAVPRSVVPVIYGEDGGCLKRIREISDAKVTITDPKPGATETKITISGTPEQTHAAQSLIQAFVLSETEAS